MLGIDDAIQETQAEVHKLNTGGEAQAQDESVSGIRLKRLSQLRTWLDDDHELLQSAIDRLSGQERRNKRRR
jgi:hypothetical protein